MLETMLSIIFQIGPLAIAFISVALTGCMYAISVKSKYHGRLPAFLNIGIFSIASLFLLFLLPIEILNLWRDIITGPSPIKFRLHIFPAVLDYPTLSEIIFVSISSVFAPCVLLYVTFKFFVLDFLRDLKRVKGNSPQR